MFSARPLTRKKNETLFRARGFRLLIYRAYQPGRGWSDLVRRNYPVRSEVFHAAFRTRPRRFSVARCGFLSSTSFHPDSAMRTSMRKSISIRFDPSATRFIGGLLRRRLARAASRSWRLRSIQRAFARNNYSRQSESECRVSLSVTTQPRKASAAGRFRDQATCKDGLPWNFISSRLAARRTFVGQILLSVLSREKGPRKAA